MLSFGTLVSETAKFKNGCPAVHPTHLFFYVQWTQESNFPSLEIGVCWNELFRVLGKILVTPFNTFIGMQSVNDCD